MLVQVGHLTGAGNHGPPSNTRVPILLTNRLSLRRGGAFACAERGASVKRDREALPFRPGPFPIPRSVVNGR